MDQEFAKGDELSQDALDQLESDIFGLYKTYLELHQHVLIALYQHMNQLGVEFFIIDDSALINLNHEREFGSIRSQGRARRSLHELEQSS